MRRPIVGCTAPERTHVATVAGEGRTGGGLFCLRLLAMSFGKARVEMPDGRNVEAIEPDHWPVAGIAVVVPLPARSQHEVERLHHCPFPVDGGEPARSLQHETQRALRVAMGRGNLAGQDQLDAGIETGHDRRLPGQSRIFEDQHPALGLFSADQVARAQQIVADRTIGPAMDLGRRFRLGSH